MIRYRIGDFGGFPAGSKPGHPTFVLSEVLGREVDRLVMPDGRWVTGLQVPHLMKDFPVREFLCRQRQDYSIEIQIVPQTGFNESNRRQIEETLKTNLPGLPITIELKESVVRTVSNKWRPVISEARI
jgi:phenylacetate-coenzyme A ligase PaaK-like adenylate-forming protein